MTSYLYTVVPTPTLKVVSYGRVSPFDCAPNALYVPVGTEYSVEALSNGVEFAIGNGPVSQPAESREPRVITPDQVRVSTRGFGDMERTIHDILMETSRRGHCL